MPSWWPWRRTHKRVIRKDFAENPVQVAPHSFRRMGLWRNRDKCIHCFWGKGDHPTHVWLTARPWGDQS